MQDDAQSASFAAAGRDPDAGPASGSRSVLPTRRELYYGGAWQPPRSGRYYELTSPGTGESLGRAADANADDIDAAVQAARGAFPSWRDTPPLDRAKALRKFAAIV